MVKIKRKVEMTCGEFAKYMVDKFGFSSYESKLTDDDWLGAIDRRYDVSIHLPSSKVSDLPDITITKSGVVIFEVEEEITEDTVFENLIEILDGSPNCLWERASVKDWKDEDSKEFHAYINGKFKCIWRNGKLVE